jgi:hypothetical protein
MLLKALRSPRIWRPGRIRLRPKRSLRHGEAAPQSRLYSLLLPPRYPTDRR